MLGKIPDRSDMIRLVGEPLFAVWQKLCAEIDGRYDMERTWNSGGKKWVHEYKYRRGGKTLCALYAKENCVGLMMIFGKNEREKYEAVKAGLSQNVRRVYEEAETFHDGKWVMFLPTDTSEFDDYKKLLTIKRRPNRI